MENPLYAFFIVVLSVFTVIVLFACDESESDIIRALHIPELDISEVENGYYRGCVYYHKSLYVTEVKVCDHRIEAISIVQSEGDKYDRMALPVLQEVIEHQSLQVDIVTGATKSCKLYLLTIYNALSVKEIQIQQLMSERF